MISRPDSYNSDHPSSDHYEGPTSEEILEEIRENRRHKAIVLAQNIAIESEKMMYVIENEYHYKAVDLDDRWGKYRDWTSETIFDRFGNEKPPAFEVK